MIKKIIKKVFYPPLWFGIVFSVLSLAFVALIFLFQINGIAAYISYLCSAFGLYYLINMLLVPLVGKIKALLYNGKYTSLYFTNKEFNARFGLYSGTAVNIVYALFKLVSGIIFRSEWLIAIAVYYILLSGIKFYLIRSDLYLRYKVLDNNERTAWKSYRNVGWLILLINLALSGIIVQVVMNNKSFSYPGTIIFISALYAFYRLGIAIKGMLTDRKNRSPIISASKSINCCVAVVAMFTLQTAMLAQFSTASEFDRTINIITGTAVALIVTVISIFMVVTAIVTRKRIDEADRK